jgi:hypothetical protein
VCTRNCVILAPAISCNACAKAASGVMCARGAVSVNPEYGI